MKITIPEKANTLIREVITGQTFVFNGILYLKLDYVYDAETLDNEIDEDHDLRASDDIEATKYCAVNLSNGILASFSPSTKCDLVGVECNVKYI